MLPVAAACQRTDKQAGRLDGIHRRTGKMNPAKPGIQIHINRLHLSALKQSPHQIFCQPLPTGMK
jgi:hypothetical protein